MVEKVGLDLQLVSIDSIKNIKIKKRGDNPLFFILQRPKISTIADWLSNL